MLEGVVHPKGISDGQAQHLHEIENRKVYYPLNQDFTLPKAESKVDLWGRLSTP